MLLFPPRVMGYMWSMCVARINRVLREQWKGDTFKWYSISLLHFLYVLVMTTVSICVLNVQTNGQVNVFQWICLALLKCKLKDLCAYITLRCVFWGVEGSVPVLVYRNVFLVLGIFLESTLIFYGQWGYNPQDPTYLQMEPFMLSAWPLLLVTFSSSLLIGRFSCHSAERRGLRTLGAESTNIWHLT